MRPCILFNAGLVCSAGSRLYVHKSTYEQTLQALATSLEAVVIGEPLDPNTTQGPQISRVQFESIMGYIQIGKDLGPEQLDYFLETKSVIMQL